MVSQPSHRLALGEPVPQGRLADLADAYAPEVPWSSFLPLFARGSDGFKQGDHVTILAPTGGGKTTLAREVVGVRDYVIGLFTKPRDPLVTELTTRDGYMLQRHLEVRIVEGVIQTRHIALNPITHSGDIRDKRSAQADEIRIAINYAYDTGGWCLWADDLLWIVKHLRLGEEGEAIWYHGRTSDISFVACGQRPRHAPLAAYSQVEHLFLGHTGDRDDIRRLGEIGAAGRVDVELVRYIVARLERFQFLYVKPHDGVLLRVRADV